MTDNQSENEEIVDLTNVREIIKDDKAMAEKLFGIFITDSMKYITMLENNCTPDASEIWKDNAHALKGVALSLGANKLAKASNETKANHNASPEEKTNMLNEIKSEFQKVKEFLKKLS